jgi:hypothetical protein
VRTIHWLIITALLILFTLSFFAIPKCESVIKFKSSKSIGDAVDSLNGVVVYYNGSIGNVTERNVAGDNYNLGLKYQFVEFVKRYYYEYYHHKMPDSYGHAKDFFDCSVEDGRINSARNLVQYCNPGKSKPAVGDLLVFSGHQFNKYGHVAIVSDVSDSEIEIIQQNPGPNSNSRGNYNLSKKNGKWELDNDGILGWLRKE